MDQHSITPRQLQLLQAIARFKANKAYSATIQELASQLEISRTTAFEHLAALREKGFIQGSPNKARSLKVTTSGQKLLKTAGAPSHVLPLAAVQNGLPLIGQVAAGRPIDAIESHQTISLDQFGSTDTVFALQVKGDSMINDGIFDGDYVICKKTSTAQNGQLVVAIVDNDTATVKRFFREAEHIRLEPANEKYSPILTRNCRVEAAVVGLIRRF